jgi:hypothetical protein
LWHKELLIYFGTTFGDKLRAFHKKISDERMKLQQINFKNVSFELMEAIMIMWDHDSHFTIWETEME